MAKTHTEKVPLAGAKRATAAPTLADVARRAGVSSTTASFVLNNREAGIPAETRRRVLDAARDLRYTANALVTALKQRRMQTIGVHFNSARGMFPSDPVMGRALAGIGDAAHERRHHTLLYTGLPDGEGEVPAAAFLDRRVDGMVLVAPQIGSALLDEMADAHLPCAVLFSRCVPEGLAYVDADNAQGARLAVEHLAGLGHRRIAHLAGSSRSSNFVDRADAYRAALEDRGIPFDPSLVLPVDLSTDYRTVLPRLLALPEPPTALFCHSDGCAVRAIHAAAAMGVRVPDDLSLVGFDDCVLAAAVFPALTTIRQPLQEMGQQVASTLIDLIQGVPAEERRITVPVALVVRGTTAPPLSSG